MIEYKGYKFAKDGTAYLLNGKLIENGRVSINKIWYNSIDIAKELYKPIPKQTVVSKPVKVLKTVKPTNWVHGNKDKKHSAEAKQLMRTNKKLKPIIVNGVKYASITEATQILGVNRSTIYRNIKT